VSLVHPDSARDISRGMFVVDTHEAFEVVRGGEGGGVFVTCEHASERMPEPWRWHERDQRLVGTHWAFDLGAAELAREYAARIGTVAVLSRFSRLLCDPNRAEHEASLFRDVAEREPVHLNLDLAHAERELRLATYHRPFHHAVDRELEQRAGLHTLLSMHSFTPLYEGQPRALEVGVLFDREDALGEHLVSVFARAGFRVAPNEPYSGKEGLIHSAAVHAERFGLRAVELEVRQDLAVDPTFRARLLAVLASELR
jgi:predicted N-formylglutamate amidohydrolase